MAEQDFLGIAVFTAAMGVISTLVALPPALAAAWLLARRRMIAKPVVETVMALPLVLPPVATGFLLLQLFGAETVAVAMSSELAL